MARIAWIGAMGALCVAFTRAQGGDPSPAPSRTGNVLKYKLEAAQKAFQEIRAAEGADPEIAYRWSRRWLEAERALSDNTEKRLAALQGHRERVREIAQATNRQFRQGFVDAFQVRASEFYVAEAEAWLRQATEDGAGR